MITDRDIEKLKAVFATKDDLNRFATKDDLKNFATKDDLTDLVSHKYFHTELNAQLNKFATEIIEFTQTCISTSIRTSQQETVNEIKEYIDDAFGHLRRPGSYLPVKKSRSL